jgi:hypothetical protein
MRLHPVLGLMGWLAAGMASAATHQAVERMEAESAGEAVVIEAGTGVEVVSQSGGQAYVKFTLPSGRATILALPADKLKPVEKTAAVPARAAEAGKPEPPPPPVEGKPEQPGAAVGLSIQGRAVTPGQRNMLEVEEPEEFAALRKKLKMEPAGKLSMVLVLPRDFDPAKVYPVITAYITDDAAEPDTAAAGAFEFAAQQGWVVLAASGSGKALSARERGVNILAAARVLETEWPAVKSWKWATGGFSGGAKAAGYVAAALVGDNRRVIGIYMSGSNSATPALAVDAMKEVRRCSERELRRVPVFLSNGASDTVASLEDQKRMAEALDRAGFKKVRAESFEGGHEGNKEHTALALEWFAGLADGP